MAHDINGGKVLRTHAHSAQTKHQTKRPATSLHRTHNACQRDRAEEEEEEAKKIGENKIVL